MSKPKKTETTNRSRRTRRDLLDAAARLLKQGRKPNLHEIAEEALVSRATAYRYFPSIEALLAEVTVDIAVPSGQDLFDEGAEGDPVSRLKVVDDALTKAIEENELSLRVLLAHSLMHGADTDGAGKTPVRQNRRNLLIEAALQPSLDRLEPGQLRNLKGALAMVLGSEAFVVLRDVLRVDAKEADQIKEFALRALVGAAIRPDSEQG